MLSRNAHIGGAYTYVSVKLCNCFSQLGATCQSVRLAQNNNIHVFDLSQWAGHNVNTAKHKGSPSQSA